MMNNIPGYEKLISEILGLELVIILKYLQCYVRLQDFSLVSKHWEDFFPHLLQTVVGQAN